MRSVNTPLYILLSFLFCASERSTLYSICLIIDLYFGKASFLILSIFFNILIWNWKELKKDSQKENIFLTRRGSERLVQGCGRKIVIFSAWILEGNINEYFYHYETLMLMENHYQPVPFIIYQYRHYMCNRKEHDKRIKVCM